MKKVAIITGASRGIGAAIASLLAEDHAVCINYQHSKTQADALVHAIEKTGGTAMAVKADVRSEQDILMLFDTVDNQLGCVTTLINNAGMNSAPISIEDTTLDSVQAMFATNVFSMFITCREAIKRMKKQTHGNIINISSEAGRFGGNRMTAYAASKAAINTFTIGAARETASVGIRINAISPGVIETDMHNDISEERAQHLINSIPLGRMGKPNEIAELVKWLVSDHASYVSGAVIPVTGAR